MVLSIIIPNYNGREVLKNCLNSIYQKNRNVDYEVIVVDNDSTDGSVEMIKKDFPKTKLITIKSKAGFSKLNNSGLNSATSKYVLFLNNDTLVEGTAFDNAVKFMDDTPEAAAIGFKLLNPDNSLQPSGRSFPTVFSFLSGKNKYFNPSRNYEKTEEVDEVSGACIMTRTVLIKEINGWDESFLWGYEDLDLCRRIKKTGLKIYYFPQSRVTHYWGITRNREKLYEEEMFSALYYFHKYSSKPEFIFLLASLYLTTFLSILKHSLQGVFAPEFKTNANIKRRLLKVISSYNL
jgi:GT2 family glycosyltransferase